MTSMLNQKKITQYEAVVQELENALTKENVFVENSDVSGKNHGLALKLKMI